MMPIIDDITDDIALLAVVTVVATWIDFRGANFEFLRYAGDRFEEGVSWVDAHPVRRRMAQVTAGAFVGWIVFGMVRDWFLPLTAYSALLTNPCTGS
jgi:hypothetical protein